MLLAYPAPEPDELLTSAVIRLALANRLRPGRLTRLIGISRFWQRDPDRSATPEQIALIESATRLAPGQLQATSLRPLLEQLHGSAPHPTAPIRFLTQVGRHTRVAGTHGHPVCSMCLQGPVGGLQRGWRLSTTVLCEVHGALLIDACPRCAVPISLTRHHLADRSRRPALPWQPGICSSCGLAWPAAISLKDIQGHPALTLQRLMLSAAHTGYAHWEDLRLTGWEVQGIVEVLMRLGVPDEARASPGKFRPEFAAVGLRFQMVSATGILMTGGIEGTLERLRGQGRSALDLLARANLTTVPGWFQAVVRDGLARRPHPRRIEEAEAPDAHFRFTERQWDLICPVLPKPPATGGGRSGRQGHRRVLEAFLTRGRSGQQEGSGPRPISDRTCRRRLQALAASGALDQAIALLLADLPASALPPWADQTLEALTAPRTIVALRRLGSPEAQRLWQLGLQRARASLKDPPKEETSL